MAECFKHMNEESMSALAAVFEQWRRQGRVPDTLNTALIRMLPKTDQGLSDLSACRPIALMEHLLKLYEHIMIARVTKVVLERGMLHRGQYGAVPHCGVEAPLRVFAEMLEDARVSGRECHVFTTDYSKAFDTCQFWSQELSWRTLGMPQGLIDLMVNLDSGSEEGEGATTKIILGHGRLSPPFRMGRGVRQGSVGGPLKWIVFMNFLLEWVHHELEGEGYRFVGKGGQQTIPECWEGVGGTRGDDGMVEMLGQMFVDDSIWAVRGPGAMQRLVVLIQEFSEFHGLQLNKDKCAYFSVNAPAAPLRWKAETNDSVGLGERFTATKGKKGEVNIVLGEGPPASKGDGRMMKYLGVWFEPGAGWVKQREVLGRKFKSLRERLLGARLTLEQAIYLVNIVVVPAVAYPLVVASVGVCQLDAWDTALRAIVAKAGGIPKTMPVHIYYIPVSEGGLGLRSLTDVSAIVKSVSYISAGNDRDLGDRGSQWRGRSDGDSLYSKVAGKAAVRHFTAGVRGTRTKGTVEHCTHEAMGQLQVRVDGTPVGHSIGSVAREDRSSAEWSDVIGGDIVAYTDGGLDPGLTPRAGWGAVMMGAGSAQLVHRCKGGGGP